MIPGTAAYTIAAAGVVNEGKRPKLAIAGALFVSVITLVVVIRKRLNIGKVEKD